MSEQIQLDIPGSPEYLRLARLAVADAGARVGFSYEDIDDLRIAIDELCHTITQGADVRLHLVYSLTDHTLEVAGHCPGLGTIAAPTDLAQAILGSVVDDYSLHSIDDVHQFTFSKAKPGG